MRITDKEIKAAIYSLTTRIKDDYALDWAYGGVKLTNKSRSKDILNCGYVSKPKLYDLISAYMTGYFAAEELKREEYLAILDKTKKAEERLKMVFNENISPEKRLEWLKGEWKSEE